MNVSPLALILAAACCPPPYSPGPTEPRQQERPALAVALANSYDSGASESACSRLWEPDSDGWHACVCGLETWRCQAQLWCTDPWSLGEPDPEAIPPVGVPEAATAHLQPGCDL